MMSAHLGPETRLCPRPNFDHMRSTQTADGIKDGKDVLLGRFVSQRPYVAHLMAGANAKAESFMKTLKCEHVYLNEYRNFAEVFERVAAFIDQVYNPRSFTEFILRHKASPLSTLRAFGCAEGFRAALKGPSRGRHLCSRDVFGLHAQRNHTAQGCHARYFATARAPFGKLKAAAPRRLRTTARSSSFSRVWY